MAQNIESMLSKQFNTNEIVKLKERDDYKEIQEKIKQIQANGMLKDLEGRISNEISDVSLSFDDRVNKLKNYISISSENMDSPTEVVSKTLESAEKQIDTLSNTIGDSETGKAVKDNFNKAKKAVAGAGIGAMVMKGFNTLAEKIGSGFEWIINLFKSLFSMLGFGEKLGEVVEKVGDVLDPEKRKETIEQIKNIGLSSADKINDKLGSFGKDEPMGNFLFTPEERKNLSTLLESPDFFSDKELINIQKDLESGNIKSILDIKKDISSEKAKQISDIIFTPERELKIKELMVQKIQQSIISEYGLTIDVDKKQELNKLVQEYGIPHDSINLGKQFIDGEWINTGEILSSTFSTLMNSGIFVLKLFASGILGAKDIALTGWQSAEKIGALTLSKYGVEIPITDSILEEMNSLSDAQKSILYGLMIRKGGFLLQILGSFTQFSTRMFTELLISTPGNGISMAYSAGMNNFDGQLKNLEKISEALGQGSNGISKSLKSMSEQYIIPLNERTEVLKILKESNNDPKVFTEKLKTSVGNNSYAKQLLEKIPQKGFQEIQEIKDLIIKETPKFNLIDSKWSDRLKEKFNFFKKGNYNTVLNEVLKVENNLNNIYRNQNRYLSGGLNTVNISKLKSLIDYNRLNRNVKNLSIEITARDYPTQINTIKQIAKTSPELLGSMIAGGMFFNIILSNAKDFDMGKMLQEFSYLVPILGPIKLLTDVGFKLNKDDGSIETKNVMLGSASIIMLGTDLVTFSTQGSITGGVKYITQPFTAPISAIKNIGKIGRLSIDLAKFNPTAWKETTQAIGMKSKDILKTMKSLPGATKLAGIALFIGYVGIEYFDQKDIDELYERGYLSKEGEVNIEKIKQESTPEQKDLIMEQIILAKIRYKEGVKAYYKEGKIIVESHESVFPIVYIQDDLYLLKEIYGISAQDIIVKQIT